MPVYQGGQFIPATTNPYKQNGSASLSISVSSNYDHLPPPPSQFLHSPVTSPPLPRFTPPAAPAFVFPPDQPMETERSGRERQRQTLPNKLQRSKSMAARYAHTPEEHAELERKVTFDTTERQPLKSKKPGFLARRKSKNKLKSKSVEMPPSALKSPKPERNATSAETSPASAQYSPASSGYSPGSAHYSPGAVPLSENPYTRVSENPYQGRLGEIPSRLPSCSHAVVWYNEQSV